MKNISTIILLFFICVYSSAQVTIPPDKDQLLKGEATEIRLAIESKGFLHPQKILALKDQLGLTKSQINKIDDMIKNTPFSIEVKGQEIVEAEEDLDKLFATTVISEKTLRTKLERIGKIRADLRFMHLQFYLKSKQILTANQWERLKELKTSESK